MNIVTDINISIPKKPCGLTIGNFDGVHLGHISLLQHMRSLLPKDIPLVVYTFINHPTHVLSHLPPIPFIYTLEHKLKILSENKVDYTVLSTFTKELAETPYNQFLLMLKEKIGFTFLVLGKGARFGKEKEGTEDKIRKCAEQLNFRVEYLPKLQFDHEILSSGHIRTLIAQGEFSQASRCLGRPYSIYAPLLFEKERCHMSLYQLCLPPSKTYPVHIIIGEKTYAGRARIDRHAQRIDIDFDKMPPIHQTMNAEVIFSAKI
jgi:riboflavin kinase/FMN adenylyltransferase